MTVRESAATRFIESAHRVDVASLQPAACSNCRNSRFQPVLHADSNSIPGERFTLVRCTDCDLMQTSLRSTSRVLNDHSDDHSAQVGFHRVPESTNAARWRWLEHLALRGHFGYPPQPASLLTKILAHLAMWKFHSRLHRHEWIPFRFPGRLLDVGPQTDTFRERMQAFGWTVSSVDHPADLDTENCPDTNAAGPQFDAITMWHVLQCSADPRRLIQAAARRLRAGGLLVIEVPNINSWTFAEFREHWCGLQMPRFRQHFSQRTLSAMIPQDELRIVEVQQIGMRTWIKHSAERAVAAGRHEYRSWLAHGKAFWAERALRTEIANQADNLRLVAERRF